MDVKFDTTAPEKEYTYPIGTSIIRRYLVIIILLIPLYK